MKNNKFKIFGIIFITVLFNVSTQAQTGYDFDITLNSPAFPNNTSDQAVSIQFPDVAIWGWIEVTITSSYSNQLATGKLTKRYDISHNINGFFNQITEIPTAFGNVANQWYIGDFNHSTKTIPIYHLVSTSNVLAINIKGVISYTDNINLLRTATTISPIVTAVSPGSRQYMSIMQDRVGIGTNKPDATLAVNGTIHSKEVKVDVTGWPDYVFKKEYNLPSLEEVEKHIKTKGYLQNIPSEGEAIKSGINLGEMNAKLLQKIEELTLYIINVNKKVNELQSNNLKLNEENKVLYNKIEILEKRK